VRGLVAVHGAWACACGAAAAHVAAVRIAAAVALCALLMPGEHRRAAEGAADQARDM
jgi:hypothetical protein